MAKRLNVISVADQRKAREESNARLDEAYKKQVKMNDTAGGRFMLGTMEGGVHGIAPVPYKVDSIKDSTRDTWSFKLGDMAGQGISFLLGGALLKGVGATGAITNALTKSGAGQALTRKLATNKFIQNGARKSLGKLGMVATDKAVNSLATKTAEGVTKQLAKEIAVDTPLGFYNSQGSILSDGHKFGSKDYWKQVGLNTALDVGIGSASDLAPAFLRGLRKPKVNANLPTAEIPTTRYTKVNYPLGTEFPKQRLATEARIEINKPKIAEIQSKPLAISEVAQTSKQRLPRQARAEIMKQSYGSDVELFRPRKHYEPIDVQMKSKDINLSQGDGIDDVMSKTQNLPSVKGRPMTNDIMESAIHPIDSIGVATRTEPHLGTYAVKESQGLQTVRSNATMETKKAITERKHKTMDFMSDTTNNQEALKQATAEIGDDIDGTLNHFKMSVETGQTNSDTMVRGVALFNKLEELGRHEEASIVSGEVVSLASEYARGLQTMRWFNQISPEGRVVAVKRNVDRLNKQFANTLSQKGITVSVPDELFNRLRKASGAKEIAEVKNEIGKTMWNQIPPTLTDELSAWRYLSMLSSPRTHVRNLIGNCIFTPLRMVRDKVEATLQSNLVKQADRTKAFHVGRTGEDGALRALASKAYEEDRYIIEGMNKYKEVHRHPDAIQSRFKVINTLSKWNTHALNVEDLWFSKPAYNNSFAGFLKAKGYKASNVPEDVLKKAKEFAMNESLESTFRNANNLSDFIMKMKRYANVPLADIPNNWGGGRVLNKASSMFIDAVFPFVKTPSNVLMQATKFSPIGLMRGVKQMVKSENPAQFIKGLNNLTSGMTGTGIMALGYYMGTEGLATGKIDSSSEGKFRKMMGEQSYSVNIGGRDFNFTMDWAAPACIPFFIGVELANGKEGDGTFGRVLDAFTQMSDPVFSMSMLQGVGQAFESSRGNQEINPIYRIIGNSSESYLSQYIPTLFGQIARITASEDLDVTPTAKSATEREIQNFLFRMASKIPGLNEMVLQPKVDAFGKTDRKESLSDYALSVAQNMLLPGSLKARRNDSTTDELEALMHSVDGTNASKLLPDKKPDFDIKFGKDEMRMSVEELASYRKARGSEVQNGLQNLFNSSEYRRMSDDEKVKAISDVYRKAERSAKDEFLLGRGYSKGDIEFSKLNKTVQLKYNPSVQTKESFVLAYNSQKDHKSKMAKTMSAVQSGVSYKDINGVMTVDKNTYGKAVYATRVGLTTSDLEAVKGRADYDGNGSLKKAELISYLNNSQYTREQKRVLFDMLSARSTKYNPYR